MVSISIIHTLCQGYTAQNVSLNVTIPTFPGVTLVASVNNWITFQQRIDGTTSFSLPWANYAQGFGTWNRNYWMGLEKVYQITNAGYGYTLRVEYMIAGVGWYSTEYDAFWIDSSAQKYALHVSRYAWGDGGDFLNSPYSGCMHNGMKFTTSDSDNDLNPSGNCASQFSSAFWYNNCWVVNFNGVYGSNFKLYSCFVTGDCSVANPAWIASASRMMMKVA